MPSNNANFEPINDSGRTESRFFENLIAPEYITTKVAAHLLGVSENALRIKVYRGKIPAYKLGRHLRFKWSEIKSLFQKKE